MAPPVAPVHATPRSATLETDSVVSALLYPWWVGSLWNCAQSPEAAAAGAASGPAQTVKSPQSNSAAGVKPRSRGIARREVLRPASE